MCDPPLLDGLEMLRALLRPTSRAVPQCAAKGWHSSDQHLYVGLCRDATKALRTLLEAQAEAIGLPIVCVELPFPCTNDEYESRMDVAFERAKAEGIEAIEFDELASKGTADDGASAKRRAPSYRVLVRLLLLTACRCALGA